LNIERTGDLDKASAIINEEPPDSIKDELLDLTDEEPWAHEEESLNKTVINESDNMPFHIDQEVDNYMLEVENSLDLKEDLIELDDRVQDLEMDDSIENIVVDVEEMPFDIHQEVADKFELEECNNTIEDNLINEIEPFIINSSP
jgi:hypothetical protein